MSSNPEHCSNVLVTGYPALRARLVVEKILSTEPHTRIYGVVLSRDGSVAAQHREGLAADRRERLTLFEGDPAGMDMGLSAGELREVTSRVERLYYLSTLLDASAGREDAHYANVVGTREALEVARLSSNLRCLVLLSTAAVSGSRVGLVLENDLMAEQSFRCAVEETLAHAERIARRAMAEVPVAVVRPAVLVGDSRTGEADRFDGGSAVISLALGASPDLALPQPTRGEVYLNLVPVDFVASAVHHIGCDPRASGRTFHLVDPAPLLVNDVFDRIARSAGRPDPHKYVPGPLARALLRAPGIDRLLQHPRALAQWLATPVRHDDSNTREILAETGITCPPFDSYVQRLVAYGLENDRQRGNPTPGSSRHDAATS